MTIAVRKFGTILNGRPAGREAALVLKQLLQKTDRNEEIVLDFSDVLVFTPSYADEFLRHVRSSQYNTRVTNVSLVVQDTLSAIDFPLKSKKSD